MHDRRSDELRDQRALARAYEHKIKVLQAQLKMVRWDLERALAGMLAPGGPGSSRAP